MIKATIYFDMDGTIADLYAVENWLDDLENERVTPYIKAKPLVRMASLAKVLNRLQREGYRIGVVSWGAKNANNDYMKEIARAKREWLHKHLPSVQFDEVHIVRYGLQKSFFAQSTDDIIFDDDIKVREEWRECGCMAYDVNDIMKILKAL